MVRPVANPPNPWASTDVEYLEEPPNAYLEVFEDHTRSILAHNDSPDLGFDWSVNPYRGCFHACSYCVWGDTPILMGDGRAKAVADLRVGDEIYGTSMRGRYRRYVKTRVLDHWFVKKPAYRVALSDGTELITSGDHRFLTRRGWKHVVGAGTGPARRPHLTPNDRLLGVGRFARGPADGREYRLGYLCGMVRGDGLLRAYAYPRRNQHHSRLALADFEALARSAHYLREFGVATHEAEFKNVAGSKPMRAIRTQSEANFERVTEFVAWPDAPSLDWRKGFLAGIFDAEGSYSKGVLRISNGDATIIRMIIECLGAFGWDATVERPETHVAQVRVRGGAHEHLRFFHAVAPAISRKRSIEGFAIKNSPDLGVVAVEPLGRTMKLFDITTGTGDFISNGVISHNCYARPGHEYLSFGAGTDFDRKIVVKPDAPALLREAFEKKSWKGELVVFSGVTDCYQPLEASYRITRGCLEVCADYANPVGIITKSPLIERDIDVLVRLAKVAHVGVTISIPFWEVEKARAMEPFVTTPARRIKTIERLAGAGVHVAVNIAPMIPGLGDEDMPKILEAAKAAGAKRAGFVFLRLPGPVKMVFVERLRESLPLRAEKVLARVLEARGGKLYDPRFGARQRGEGPYAEAAKALFDATCKRLGFETEVWPEIPSTFRRPPKAGEQLRLFGEHGR